MKTSRLKQMRKRITYDNDSITDPTVVLRRNRSAEELVSDDYGLEDFPLPSTLAVKSKLAKNRSPSSSLVDIVDDERNWKQT